MSLTFRKLLFSDLDNYFLLVGDTDVMAFISNEPYSYGEAEQELKRLIAQYLKHSKFGVWAVLESDEFVGTAMMLKEGEDSASIGYKVLKSKWGRGYGLKIGKLLIEKAKNSGIKTLFAEVEMENEASLNILHELIFEEVVIRKNEIGNEVGLFKLDI